MPINLHFSVWDGPGEAFLRATIEGDVVTLYLSNEQDDWAMQSIPIDRFKVWASTALAEVALAEEEE